jgi:rubrerythrin
MQKQVLLDKLSEFLMVEQGGLQLYQLAMGRTQHAELKQRYQEFAQQTAHHHEVLTRLIQQLGGDPNYVSPPARLAQVKATKLMEAPMISDALAPAEIEVNDLENLLLAETKDHADWQLLRKIGEQCDDTQMKQAILQAVQEVEPQEDQHVQWAHDMLAKLCLQMAQQGPAPSPERWQKVISAPEPPINELNPSPVTADLLPLAREPMWQESVIVRAMRVGRDTP